jgi:hypothetical protein
MMAARGARCRRGAIKSNPLASGKRTSNKIKSIVCWAAKAKPAAALPAVKTETFAAGNKF